MSSPSAIQKLSFYTSYRQFYFADLDADYDTSSKSFWTKEALERGLAVESGVIGVSTSSYGNVRCFFQVTDFEPQFDLNPWQRVVEASIRVTKGRYAILDCPDSSVVYEGSLPSGEYRLRVYGTFLDEVVEETAGDEYFDFYWICFWPAQFSLPKSIKCFVESRPSPSAV